MAEPLRISILFDAQGEPQLRRGSEALNELATRLGRYVQVQQNTGRAARALADDINRMAQSMHRNLVPAANAVNRVFEEMYNTVGRLTRLGFYKVVAEFGALSYGLSKLFREFLKINEQFAGLEITLSSAFKSTLVARQIREELAKITATSPIAFEELAGAARSFGVIPQFSAQIGAQALRAPGSPGALTDQNGFFRRMISLVERMVTFRPDKEVKDVTFALREAATGELRSLIRRFDFPPGLLVAASGRSIDDLKKDPVGMTSAIERAIGRIISPEAVKKIAYQPENLRKNIVEQGITMPLLSIGDSGFYKIFTEYFGEFYDKLADFSSKQFKDSFAPKFSAAMTQVFYAVVGSVQNVSEKILAQIGQGFDSRNRPGESVFQRTAEASLYLVEQTANKLPELISDVQKFVGDVLPAFVKATQIFAQVISQALSLITNHPIMSLVGYAGLKAVPSMVGLGLNKMLERGIAAATSSRFAVLAGGLTGTGGGLMVPGSTVANPAAFMSALRSSSPALSGYNQGWFRSIFPGRVAAPDPAFLAAVSSATQATGNAQSGLALASVLQDPRVQRNIQYLRNLGATDLGNGRFQLGANTLIPGGPGSMPYPTANRGPITISAYQGIPAAVGASAAAQMLAGGYVGLRNNSLMGSAMAGVPAQAAALEAGAMRASMLAGFRGQFAEGGALRGWMSGGKFGALAGMGMAGLGFGAGATEAVAGGVAGLASFVVPILAIVLTTAVIGSIVGAVQGEMERRRGMERDRLLESVGLNKQSAIAQTGRFERESGDYASRVSAALIGIPGGSSLTLGDARSSSVAEFLRSRTSGMDPAERDLILRRAGVDADALLAGGGTIAYPSLVPGTLRGRRQVGFGPSGPIAGTTAEGQFIPDKVRDAEGNFATVVDSVTASIEQIQKSGVSLAEFVRMDAKIKSDIAALTEVITGKTDKKEVFLQSLPGYAVDSSKPQAARDIIAALQKADSQNSGLRQLVSRFTESNLGVDYQPELSPEQSAARRQYKHLYDTFVSGKSLPQEFFVNTLSSQFKGGGSPLSALMTKVGMVESPQIPAGIADTVAAEVKRIDTEITPERQWTKIFEAEYDRLKLVREVRSELSRLFSDTEKVAPEVEAAREKILSELKTNSEKGLLPGIDKSMIDEVISKARAGAGVAEFKDYLGIYIADFQVKAAESLTDAMNIMAKDALVEMMKASDTPTRNKAFGRVQYAAQNTVELLKQTQQGNMSPALSGADSVLAGYLDNFKSILAMDTTGIHDEAYIQKRLVEASRAFIDGWTKMLESVVEGMPQSERARMQAVLSNQRAFFAQPANLAGALSESQLQQERKARFSAQQGAFEQFFGGFEVQSGADSGRLDRVLRMAQGYAGNFGATIPSGVAGLSNLSTAGEEGFTNRIQQLDALSAAIADIQRQTAGNEADLLSNPLQIDGEDVRNLERLVEFSAKLAETLVHLRTARGNLTEGRKQRFMDDYNAVIGGESSGINTPESQLYRQLRLQGFGRYTQAQGVDTSGMDIGALTAYRGETELGTITAARNRLGLLRGLKVGYDSQAVKMSEEADYTGAASARAESEKILSNIVKLQETLHQFGPTLTKDIAEANSMLSRMFGYQNKYDYQRYGVGARGQFERGITADGLMLPDSARGMFQNDRYETGRLSRLQAYEATAANLAGQSSAKELEAIARGNAEDAESWKKHKEAYLDFASTYNREIETIIGKNGDMVSSFVDGVTEMTSKWRAAATNFSDIGRNITTGLVDNMASGFTDIAMNAKSADEAVAEFGKNMLRMAIQMLSQKALQMVFGSILGGIGGGAGALVAGTAGTATGPLYSPGMSGGGLLSGAPSSRDNMLVPMASGEFVIPAHRVRQYGVSTFEAYRNGSVRETGFSTGGAFGYTPASGGGGHSSPNVTVNVSINGDGSNAKSSVGNVTAGAEQLGRTMQQVAERVVSEHLRQGGLLRTTRKA